MLRRDVGQWPGAWKCEARARATTRIAGWGLPCVLLCRAPHVEAEGYCVGVRGSGLVRRGAGLGPGASRCVARARATTACCAPMLCSTFRSKGVLRRDAEQWPFGARSRKTKTWRSGAGALRCIGWRNVRIFGRLDNRCMSRVGEHLRHRATKAFRRRKLAGEMPELSCARTTYTSRSTPSAWLLRRDLAQRGVASRCGATGCCVATRRRGCCVGMWSNGVLRRDVEQGGVASGCGARGCCVGMWSRGLLRRDVEHGIGE